MSNDKIEIASTMTPNEVISKKITTNMIQIGPNKVTSISTDLSDTSHESLVTSRVLTQGIQNLTEQVNAIDPEHNIFRDNSVVTKTTIVDTFSDENDDWVYKNFLFRDHRAHLISSADNYLKIRSKFFDYIGTYFLIVDIERLDSGQVVIYNHYQNELIKLNTHGRHYLEFNVENQHIQELVFRCENIINGDSVIIKSISLHYSTYRIQDYLLYKISNVASGDLGGFVTQVELDFQVSQLENKIQQLKDSLDGANLDEVLTHINNKNNPHGITPEGIKAATEKHTHLKKDITDFEHEHNASECNALPSNYKPVASDVVGLSEFIKTTVESESIDILEIQNRIVGLEFSINQLSESLTDFIKTTYTESEIADDDEGIDVDVTFTEAIYRAINNTIGTSKLDKIGERSLQLWNAPKPGYKVLNGSWIELNDACYKNMNKYLELNPFELKTVEEYNALSAAAGNIGGVHFYCKDASGRIRLPDARGDYECSAGYNNFIVGDWKSIGVAIDTDNFIRYINKLPVVYVGLYN